MKRAMKFLSNLIMCAAIMFSAPVSAATNLPAGGDIGEFGAWTTEHNLESFTTDISRDLTEFQAGFQNQQLVKDYVPIEAKAGLAFMNAMSWVAEILDGSLVRFVVIFIIIAYIFWAMFETYQMMTTKSNVRDLAKSVIKKGATIAIWIIILQFGPARVFMWIMGPIITVGTYLSDFILNTIADVAGVDLPDTCTAIREYTAAHTPTRMLIDANAAADMMCVPTRLSGFFYTAIAAGFKWMLAGIGHSAFSFVIGVAFVVLFVYNAFKFAFIALGVIADLFLAVIMLPFTAIAETVGKTSYKGIAGTIFNGFLGLFKVESLSAQIQRFINAALYFVSLSIVVALCAALLSGIIDMNMAAQVPSLKDDNFMVVLLSGILVAYLANHAMDIAKKIGGSIDDSMGQKIKTEATRLWNNAYGEYKKWKKIIKENKK